MQLWLFCFFFFFSSRRRHTRLTCDWSSDVCSSDLRQPLFAASSGYGIFEQELEKVRQRHGFVVAGYVVMPEHVHLLVSEPRTVPLSVALQVLKQQVSRKLKRPGDI